MGPFSAGFSLLEMTIALAILGVVGSFAFPLLSYQIERARHQTTKKHQEAVMEAIESYFVHNECLPWPGDPLGKGESYRDPLDENAMGIIPYRLLGLPESVAKDGFGYYMTYAITPSLGNRGPGNDVEDWGREQQTKIEISDEVDSVLKDDTNTIVYVLISHGPGGNGAYTGKNDARKIKTVLTSHDEEENNSDSLTFRTRNYSTNPNNLFRHKLAWKTAKELYKVYADLRVHNLTERKEKLDKGALMLSKSGNKAPTGNLDPVFWD